MAVPMPGPRSDRAAGGESWLAEGLRAVGPVAVIRTTGAPLPPHLRRWLKSRGAEGYSSARAVNAAALEALCPGGFVLLQADVFNLGPVLEDVRTLRRAGHVGAIVALIDPRGVRATTPLELTRAGVDEVMRTTAGVAEFASRVELAIQYATLQPDRPSTSPALFWTQPQDVHGALRLLSPSEMREILVARLRREAYSDFTFLRLVPGDGDTERSWTVLQGRMRIREGDLVARLDDSSLGLLFESLPRGSAGAVVARVLNLHPGCEAADRVAVFQCPEDRVPLLEWILRVGRAGGE